MALVLGTPLERFETRFAPLMRAARTLPGVVEEALLRHYPQGIPGYAMPAATASRMLLAVDPLYHAAVQSLAEPDTALGALALMRPIIEAWCHLFWILGLDGAKDAPCRAIRLEQMWMGSSLGVAHASKDVEEIRKAEHRRGEIRDLYNSTRCTGGPRKYGDTETTVIDVSAKLQADWLPAAWRSSSQMVHVGGWDWALVDRGDGVSVLQSPTPSHRATRLNHLIIIYYNVAMAAVELTGAGRDSDAARTVYATLLAVRDDKFLLRAIDGDYD